MIAVVGIGIDCDFDWYSVFSSLNSESKCSRFHVLVFVYPIGHVNRNTRGIEGNEKDLLLKVEWHELMSSLAYNPMRNSIYLQCRSCRYHLCFGWYSCRFHRTSSGNFVNNQLKDK